MSGQGKPGAPLPRVLLVEDEPNIAFNLEFNLAAEGFQVVVASTGTAAIEAYHRAGPFALVILDIMLPEMDGFAVAKEIRRQDPVTGILFLSAMASESDILTGLKLGADDYITKPFSLAELLLRVKRMAKRGQLLAQTGQAGQANEAEMPGDAVIVRGDLALSMAELSLTSPKGRFTLTALEADVLAAFLAHPGRILTREFLLENVWGIKGSMETRTVDNFVRRLRQFVEDNPSKPTRLESVRGKGYRLNDPNEQTLAPKTGLTPSIGTDNADRF